MISCPNCGSNPRFDIATQKLLCPYCGSSFDVESFPEETSGATMQQVEGEYVGEPDKMQVTVYTCSQCGGELMSTDSDATAFCSYCGSHQILEERLSLQERPQRIIPFKITKEDCKKTYASKLKRSLFAPKVLKDPTHIDEFRAIYMPYWFYNFRQEGKITLNGTTEHREGDYRIVDSYHLSVDADNTFRGINHDASTSFEDKISESLAPYDVKETVPFRTAYLSGFYADIPDLKKTSYEKEAAAMAARDTIENIEAIEDFRKYDLGEMNDVSAISRTRTTLESAQSSMLPVWFLSYRKQDRVAYAAINGQTGKITADIPIDPARYLIGVGIVTAILWIILQAFNISSLRGILMTVILGALAGSLIYGMVVHQLQENIQNREWENYMRQRAREEEAAREQKARMQKARMQNTQMQNAQMQDNQIQDGPVENDAPEAKQTEPKAARKKARNKKSKAPKPPKKENSSPGIGITFIMWLVLVAAVGVLMFLDMEWLILAEPILAAGYVYLGFSEKSPKKGQISNLALGISTTLGVVIWLINPYIDWLYYGCCVLMMGCVIWCFFDALYYYNQLMTRPLPQFQKQGGDDRA